LVRDAQAGAARFEKVGVADDPVVLLIVLLVLAKPKTLDGISTRKKTCPILIPSFDLRGTVLEV
jgi:hypothetical protein